jgi:hypothetical protein
VRKGMTFRSPFFMAGCSRMQNLRATARALGRLGESSNDHKDDIFGVKAHGGSAGAEGRGCSLT